MKLPPLRIRVDWAFRTCFPSNIGSGTFEQTRSSGAIVSMIRLLRSLGISALVAGCAAAQRSAPVGDADLAIAPIAVIDVERGRVVRDQAVLLKGNRIVAVMPT